MHDAQHARALSPAPAAPVLPAGLPSDARGPRTFGRLSRRVGRRRWTRSLGVLALAALVAVLTARNTRAANNGTLTVTATVAPAIQLIFVNAVGASETTIGYCPVTSSGTPDVGLDFGTCSRNTGCSRACVLFTKLAAGGSNPYTAESAFDLIVTKANATSGSYNVQARLGTAPPVEVTYYINTVQLTTSNQLLPDQATNAYGTRVSQDLMIRIRNNMPAATLNQTIHYVATSN